MSSFHSQIKVSAFFTVLITFSISGGCISAAGEWGSDAPSHISFSDDIDLDPTLAQLRGMIERYSADHAILQRKYTIPMSESTFNRYQRFVSEWSDTLNTVNFSSLNLNSKVDFLLFKNRLNYSARKLKTDQQRHEDIKPLIPFWETIIKLEEARQQMLPINAEKAASTLTDLSNAITEAKKSIEADLKEKDSTLKNTKKTVANRAVRMAGELRRILSNWHKFYNGYDPLFTWWVETPHEKVQVQLIQYTEFLRKKFVGNTENNLIGDPIGRDTLLSQLEYEMLPYTPEELIEIANREYAWCLNEMLKASNELGFGDDWHKALNHVKSLHVQPGEQPAMIKELAWEAIDFLEERDLVTIPELCKESWRMQMMSPQQQKISPYFLGGETILVAFPTNEMDHADKLMALRGNNRHFARATVHHELIPGHHLQGFMTSRFQTHRRLFNTPFWGEGWALYWEMLLWDEDFPQSPENRVGMLFWRMHRCARIIFSLSFHLEKMTAKECIEYLIENVGHERNNATAEVRRSIAGNYGPLYQAAYMLGGLQLRSLHKELVETGKMTNSEFHDAILRLNSIPIDMVRISLTDEDVKVDYKASWKFYGDVELAGDE